MAFIRIAATCSKPVVYQRNCRETASRVSIKVVSESCRNFTVVLR